MRITSHMLANNLSYQISKQLGRLNDLETVVAAGKNLLKSSDDPAASAQIVADRATISAYGQYASNIAAATTWVKTSNTTLDSTNMLLQEAKTIIASRECGDAEENTSYIEELQSIYDQVLALANSRYQSTYMYAGNDSKTMPFDDRVTLSGQNSSAIVFELSQQASALTIEITDSSGNVVRTMTLPDGVEGTNKVVWDGCDDSGEILPDGRYRFAVSASDSSGNEVAAYATYRGGSGGKEVIIGNDHLLVLNNNGDEIFTAALRALSRAIAGLKSSTGADSTDELSASLREAMAQIQLEQVALSNIQSQLETRNSRLEQLAAYLNDKVSASEGSTTEAKEEATVKLQAQKTAYETALAAASDALKMRNLADYL